MKFDIYNIPVIIDDELELNDWWIMPGDNLKPNSQGWECPKCGKVWAPWVSSCDCHKRDYISPVQTSPGFGWPWSVRWDDPDLLAKTIIYKTADGAMK